jgi:hypothetical protein
MKSKHHKTFALPAACALFAALQCHCSLAAPGAGPGAGPDPHKADSIDQSKSHIKTEQGRKIWQSEMEGKDSHALTAHLPDGLTQDELSRLVFNKPYDQMLKMKDQDVFQRLGAIKHPGREGLYIGAGSVEHFQGLQGSGPEYAGIEIVVFKMPAPHKPEIVARTTQPMAFVNGHPTPTSKSTDEDNLEDQLVSFDRAVFKIAPDKYAFGLRLSHNDMYAGGGGQVHFLHLFTVDNGQIAQVFGSPIYDYQLIAGDWNKDQTRQHFTYEDNYALSIESTTTNGYNDLLLVQTLSGKQRCRFAWSDKSKSYAGKDKVPAIYYAQNRGQ